MSGRSLKLLVSAALILTVGYGSASNAQSRRWRSVRGRPLVKFDWNCASPSAYPEAKLGGLLRALLKRKYPDRNAQADRAFAFDLNGDRRPEYFVPLVCGATGNCDWGVFALNPARLLGTISGQYVFVHTRPGRWPDVIIYGHLNAAEGTLGTYGFRRGRYVDLGDSYAIGDTNRGSEFQQGALHDMPKFLDTARAGCEHLGW